MTTAHQPPLVTIGICTRNRAQSILAAVEHVLTNTYSNFELLVIDQSTNTDTALVLAEARADPRVRYVVSHERGVSRGRNIVLEQARGTIVLMTDDDCTVPANWIEQMVDVFDRFPQAGIVFCRVEAAPYDSNTGDTPVLLCTGEDEFDTIAAIRDFNLMGAGMGMRCTIAREAGGFDCALGPGSTFSSGEDFDLTARTILNGYSMVRTNATSIIHHGFRPSSQAHTLMIRTYTGVGALMAKLIRFGGWPFLLLMLRYIASQLVFSVHRLVRNSWPIGFGQLVWFYRGFYYAWRTPINQKTGTFALSPTQVEKLAFLLVDA